MSNQLEAEYNLILAYAQTVEEETAGIMTLLGNKSLDTALKAMIRERKRLANERRGRRRLDSGRLRWTTTSHDHCDPTDLVPDLTPLEIGVWRAVAEGRTTREAAEELAVSRQTVVNCLDRITEKYYRSL